MPIETICNNCGKTVYKRPVDIRKNKTHFCDRKCMIEYRRSNSDYKKLMSEYVKRSWQKPSFIKKLTEERRGKNNPNWRDGAWKIKDAFINKIRKMSEYAEWRNKILERDVKTYPKLPNGIQVHHIKALTRIIHENNIKTLEDAKNCDELWDINNGCVLTKGEHMIITWLNRKKYVSEGFLDYLIFFMGEYFDSYYSWCK